MTMAEDLRHEATRDAFRRALRGSETERVTFLFEVARTRPLALARLVEAHLDACVILAEAGLRAEPGMLYGVWASRGDVQFADGTASGTKPFCSGVGVVDRALVTATSRPDEGLLLLDVDAHAGADMRHETARWATPALSASATGTAHYRRRPVGRVVGRPGFYLDRAGFWIGALRPAACWAGGAAGLLDAAAALVDVEQPHAAAHLGAMHAQVWSARSALLLASDRTADADAEALQRHALATRQVVERAATAVLDHFGRALGPRPYVAHGEVARRATDLHLYLRQHHAERDLERLGRLVARR